MLVKGPSQCCRVLFAIAPNHCWSDVRAYTEAGSVFVIDEEVGGCESVEVEVKAKGSADAHDRRDIQRQNPTMKLPGF